MGWYETALLSIAVSLVVSLITTLLTFKLAQKLDRDKESREEKRERERETSREFKARNQRDRERSREKLVNARDAIKRIVDWWGVARLKINAGEAINSPPPVSEIVTDVRGVFRKDPEATEIVERAAVDLLTVSKMVEDYVGRLAPGEEIYDQNEEDWSVLLQRLADGLERFDIDHPFLPRAP
ncbi:MAG: hypothetical protein ABIH23_22590 [bacterium]